MRSESGSGPGVGTWETTLVGHSSHWQACDSGLGIVWAGQGSSTCSQVCGLVLKQGGPSRVKQTLTHWQMQEPGWSIGNSWLGYHTFRFARVKDVSRLCRARLQNLPVRVGIRDRLGQARLQHLTAKAKMGDGLDQAFSGVCKSCGWDQAQSGS